ncbi:YhcN/YlaJ family sporulation lipoprotein [Pseudoneobacillus sp. C159]
MKKFIGLLTLIQILSVTGCNQTDEEKESRVSLLKTTDPSPVQITNKQEKNIAEEVKNEVNKFGEIYDVAVITGKNDTLVVYKVKHLKRFKMKQIEKKVINQLQEKFPKENFTVSSDYKIFMEAVELKDKADDPKFSDKKAEKELQKIIRLKNEQT